MSDLKQSFSFEETPSVRALHFLNHMSFNKFKSISAKKCKNEEDRFDCFNRMKNYVKTALDSKGVVKCEYGYSSSTPPLLGGRLFANNSIQQIALEIRGKPRLRSVFTASFMCITYFKYTYNLIVFNIRNIRTPEIYSLLDLCYIQ